MAGTSLLAPARRVSTSWRRPVGAGDTAGTAPMRAEPIGDEPQDADGGTTLVELLIVMIVIGILAGIAIPVFLFTRGQSTEATMRSDLRSAATAMESYYADRGHYPVDLVVLGVADRTSPHNTLAIEEVEEGGYCLAAVNPGVTGPIRYDSRGGGLLPVGASCA